MPFNVGDVVSNCGTEYVIEEVATTGKVRIKIKNGAPTFHSTWYRESLFTLVTPAGPPPSVLTGMTQFFKDQKEKTNGTA
jgi:hypothetical protein